MNGHKGKYSKVRKLIFFTIRPPLLKEVANELLLEDLYLRSVSAFGDVTAARYSKGSAGQTKHATTGEDTHF